MVKAIKEHLHTMFSDLTFDSQRHLYFWRKVRIPVSVTKLVEDYVPPFDEVKFLTICAKKEGITEHELKHKWQTINKLACELGTETHDFLERYTGLESPSTPQQVAGIKFFKDIIKDYYIVARELRMYSKEFNFAGTADLLLMHKVTGELFIVDYKTNKDIFKTFGMMKPPFGYLESHPYNHYQLQFCFYQLILEEINVKISGRKLVYLKADSTYQIYDTFDFTKDLKTTLNANKRSHTKGAIIV